MSCPHKACSLSAPTSSLPYANPNISRVYESIIMYYGDILMYKVECSNPSYSMYATRVICLTSENRYLFAICEKDLRGLGAPMKLSSLQWISFQARVSTTEYPVDSIFVEGIQTNDFIDANISQIEENNNSATYKVDGYPIIVQLIGNNAGYRSTGTVGEALQTYCTVIYFT